VSRTFELFTGTFVLLRFSAIMVPDATMIIQQHLWYHSMF